jgi:hypothetical protein
MGWAQHVADILGASSKEIIFTSGATESNNLAIKGVAHFYKEKKRHVITTQIEHKCVLDSCRSLEQEGFRVTYLPVQKNGLVDLNVLKETITEDTGLVSIMAVNNEIGVLQPLREIGKICRERKVGPPAYPTAHPHCLPYATLIYLCVCVCVCVHVCVSSWPAAGLLPLRHGADGGQDAGQRGRLQHRPGLHLEPQGAPQPPRSPHTHTHTSTPRRGRLAKALCGQHTHTR